jgi:signal recognition particle receptor subunit beta
VVSEIFDPHESGRYVPRTVQQSVKIIVVGAFGVGKTTLIGSVSEITPLRTEEIMTTASIGIDSRAGVPSKETTTVAMDFGRITLDADIVLYLFGAPGQQRFWNMWQDLATGAIGALVIIDVRSLAGSFDVLCQLEEHTIPFAVAINQFPDTAPYTDEQMRGALDLLPDTPVLRCDARDHESSVQALIAVVEHALTVPDSAEALT